MIFNGFLGNSVFDSLQDSAKIPVIDEGDNHMPIHDGDRLFSIIRKKRHALNKK